MAKWQAMSAGALKMPVVLRCSVGSKYGAQHSQDWSGAGRAYPGPEGLLSGHALRRQGPARLGAVERRSGGLLREPAALRHGRAVPRRRRSGRLLPRSRSASRTSSARDGRDHPHHRPLALSGARRGAIELEARLTASPPRSSTRARWCRSTTIRCSTSVRKTGRLLIVSEASERGSFAMTLAANVTRFAFRLLKAPPARARLAELDRAGRRHGSDLFPAEPTTSSTSSRRDLRRQQRNRRGLRNWNDLDLARRAL